MIETQEQFERAEEALGTMKRFLLVARRTHTPERTRRCRHLSCENYKSVSETFSSISVDPQKWLLAMRNE